MLRSIIIQLLDTLSGLADKDAAAHTQMWECLLVFFRAFPGVLAAMDMSKAVLPRLFTLIRSGAYGSAVGTFSFLVPFAQLCKFLLLFFYFYY